MTDTRICRHCGEMIYLSQGIWYHESTADRQCRIPRPTATPVEEALLLNKATGTLRKRIPDTNYWVVVSADCPGAVCTSSVLEGIPELTMITYDAEKPRPH
jgi:hypothetical protein